MRKILVIPIVFLLTACTTTSIQASTIETSGGIMEVHDCQIVTLKG
jgi:hypothetical protein